MRYAPRHCSRPYTIGVGYLLRRAPNIARLATPFALLAASLSFGPAPAFAEELYVANMHVLQPDGRYRQSEALAATVGGVSKTECDMRKEAWEKEFEEAIAIAMQTLRESGKSASIRITCDRQ